MATDVKVQTSNQNFYQHQLSRVITLTGYNSIAVSPDT